MACRGLAAALLALALAGLPAGCAYVTAQPVKPGDKINGIRIYDVKPLLVVSGETVKLELVPNYNRAYALRFGAFLAKNQFKANMTNGVLTSVDANMDTTALVDVIKALVDKIPEGFSGTGPAAATGGIKDRFQVYEIVFDDDGNLTGLRPLIIEQNLLRVKTSSAAAQGFSGTTVVVPQVSGSAVVVPQPANGAVTPGPITP
jgi:hypothetical protein